MSNDAWSFFFSAVQAVTGILGFGAAVWAILLARSQLKPIRRELERLSQEDRRRSVIKDQIAPPQKPREIIGFDSRFKSWDWAKILHDLGPIPNITFSLSREYDEFHHGIVDALKGGRCGKSVLIIDLVYVPELLNKKLIVPLDQTIGLDFDHMLRLRSKVQGFEISESTALVMKTLCTNYEDGKVGALPIWINSHGRLISDPQAFAGEGRLSNVNSFDSVISRRNSVAVLQEAAVQSNHLFFEFWGHLAYRGCRLVQQLEGCRARSDVLGRDRQRFAEAVADLATRLMFSNLTCRFFKDASRISDFKESSFFQIGHAGDARLIRESMATWKPLFSSELLWRCFGGDESKHSSALANDTEFRPPFAMNHGSKSWSYMSALGGYGVALPAMAADDKDTIRALVSIFLANPRVYHPYLNEMVPDESQASDVVEFLGAHARPRWHFWLQVEHVINEALLSILLEIPRGNISTPLVFWNTAWDVAARSEDRLKRMLDEVARVARMNGWHLEF